MTTKNIKIVDDNVINNIDNNLTKNIINNDINLNLNINTINSHCEHADKHFNVNSDSQSDKLDNPLVNTLKRDKQKIIINDEIINLPQNTPKELEVLNVTIITNNNILTNSGPTIKNSNDFLKELLLKQLTNINLTKKLTYNDIKRISKFLTSSIFDENKCSIWNGYITNEKNQVKGTYINFYFNQKKIALHRLLYLNFIGDILNTEYIKFSCVNKGKCCNIHHMKKFSYNSTLPQNKEEFNHIDNSVHIVQNKNDLVIEL